MDVSPEYVKMCEKAWEVQAERPIRSDQFGHYDFVTLVPIMDNFVGRAIWLPRQDQLQILSGLSWYLFDKTCVTWATTNPDYQGESKEIVGLRVVMKSLYSKIWVNGEWSYDRNR